MQVDPNVFERLRELLAEMTITNVAEIIPESHLEEDLAFNLEEDSARLVKNINRRFDVHLDQESVMDEMEEAGATALELTKLIHDELELG